ncbi:MAG: hypothetical protein ACFFAN_02910 [Promethearchaeota archaeon]
MSVIYKRERKKKKKYPRNRVSRKIIRRQRIKRNIIKSRGWKLAYPEIFEFTNDYPYIVRKNEKINK